LPTISWVAKYTHEWTNVYRYPWQQFVQGITLSNGKTSLFADTKRRKNLS
jgi:hypothetical protein